MVLHIHSDSDVEGDKRLKLWDEFVIDDFKREVRESLINNMPSFVY